MQFTRKGKIVLIAAALTAMSPGVALAAQSGGDTTTTRTTSTVEDDRDFPWGLLGLLGLAGLLGLRKKERDIHVDARRNPGTHTNHDRL